MTLRLYEHSAHPSRIGVSETDTYVEDGMFFLDFTRPLEVRRRFGVAVGAFVPIVHIGERRGGYVAGVDRSDPAFETLKQLWKIRYPAPLLKPSAEAEPLRIVADFGAQFPRSAERQKT